MTQISREKVTKRKVIFYNEGRAWEKEKMRSQCKLWKPTPERESSSARNYPRTHGWFLSSRSLLSVSPQRPRSPQCKIISLAPTQFTSGHFHLPCLCSTQHILPRTYQVTCCLVPVFPTTMQLQGGRHFTPCMLNTLYTFLLYNLHSEPCLDQREHSKNACWMNKWILLWLFWWEPKPSPRRKPIFQVSYLK